MELGALSLGEQYLDNYESYFMRLFFSVLHIWICDRYPCYSSKYKFVTYLLIIKLLLLFIFLLVEFNRSNIGTISHYDCSYIV